MPLKFLPILLLSLLIRPDVTAAVGGVRLGGWQPIKNVKAAEVQEIAKFAIAEHNKQANTDLKMQSVVRGETQVVSGTNYRLVIAAEDGAVSAKYEAVVWDVPWQHYRNLTSFKEI